jgi:hypothetical protein
VAALNGGDMYFNFSQSVFKDDKPLPPKRKKSKIRYHFGPDTLAERCEYKQGD